MDIILSAEQRDLSANKNKLRKNGFVLGSVYSRSLGSMPIQLNEQMLKKCLQQGATKIHLKVGGQKYMAAIEEVQKNAVGSQILHVAFHAFSANEKVTITVPIHLVGKSHGQTSGGVLGQQLSHVDLYGYPGDIPDSLDVDVSKLELGQSIHIGDLAKGKFEIKDSADKVIVACNYPRQENEEPTVAELAPEVEQSETVAVEASETSKKAA